MTNKITKITFIIVLIAISSIFILLVFNVGATPVPTIEDCLRISKLKPINKYRIVDTLIEEAVGDYLESHTLVISRNDYLRLVSEIRAKPFFIEYDSSARARYAYDSDSDWSKTTESAFSQKGKTFYDRLDPKLGEVIRILLKDDSLLIVEYQNL